MTASNAGTATGAGLGGTASTGPGALTGRRGGGRTPIVSERRRRPTGPRSGPPAAGSTARGSNGGSTGAVDAGISGGSAGDPDRRICPVDGVETGEPSVAPIRRSRKIQGARFDSFLLTELGDRPGRSADVAGMPHLHRSTGVRRRVQQGTAGGPASSVEIRRPSVPARSAVFQESALAATTSSAARSHPSPGPSWRSDKSGDVSGCASKSDGGASSDAVTFDVATTASGSGSARTAGFGSGSTTATGRSQVARRRSAATSWNGVDRPSATACALASRTRCIHRWFGADPSSSSSGAGPPDGGPWPTPSRGRGASAHRRGSRPARRANLSSLGVGTWCRP